VLKAARKKDTQFGRIAEREVDAAKFIPYSRHYDDTTLKTKAGYLLKIIKIEGLPFETADQTDLNTRKNIRATLLRGISNSRFAVYHHTIRRRVADKLDGLFENDWCRELDKTYQDKLSQKNMFVNEQYITIIRRPPQSKIGIMSNITNTIFSTVDRSAREQKDIENLRALNEAVNNIVSTLEPYKPKVLAVVDTDNGSFSEPLSFLSYLVNLEDKPIRLPACSIDNYLPEKRVSFGRETFELRGAASSDIKLGAVLSVKEYDNATGPGMLDSFLGLPHEFILTQSFGFVDRQTSLSAMNEAERKMIASEQGADSLIMDIQEAKNDLSSGKSSFGEHHISLTVFANNKDQLDRSISDSLSAFTNLGLICAREDVNLEPAFWANLPANFNFISRRSLISNRNFASFASLHTFPAGSKNQNHWGSAITRLETTSGTPYWFNFHERDVGNFTVIGPTGTGKTVLLTFLMAQAQRLKPRSVYFDKDRGAEIFIRAIGGEYTIVSPGKPTGLNPLQLEDTPKNRGFLRDWLQLLVSDDNHQRLTSKEIDIISDAVNASFDAPRENRRLRYIAELLAGYGAEQGTSLGERIAKWHSNGERAWLFDNEEDSLSFDKNTIGFDLTSILDDKTSRAPWLLYVFHRIDELLDGEKTILLLDEGWKMLDDPVFTARIKDWMKTIRKQNGILGFATQSVRDALNSEVGDTIIEQSFTQIFLPNNKASEEDYCKGFGLTHQELMIIRELTPESRCFLVKHGTDSVIAKLDLNNMDDFISVLSGRTETVKLLEEIMKEKGQSPDDWLDTFLQRRKKL
jgi:type IV secretion system protein VirB4